MSAEVPEGWRFSKVGNLVNIKTGKLDANAAVKGGQYKFFTCSRNDYEIDSYSFDADAIIIAGNGDLNVKRHCGKFDAYQRTYVLTSKDAKVLDTDFFFFWESIYVEKLRDLSVGGVIKYIKLGMLADVEILLPPLPEQKRIAEILCSVDESIRATEAVISQAERVKRGLMDDLLTGGLGSAAIANGEVPEGWKVLRLGEISKIYTGKTPSTKEPTHWGGEIPFVTPSDLNGSVYIGTTERSLTRSGAAKLSLLPANSVLYTCIASIGKSGINTVPCVSNQQINSCVFDSENDPIFHYYQLQRCTSALEALSGKTAVSIINKSKFSDFEILCPRLPEQQRIAEILSSVDTQITTNRATVEQLQRLKRGLMDDLLTGKVRTVA